MNTNKKVGIEDIVNEGKTILKECRAWVADKYLDGYMKEKGIKNTKKLSPIDYKYIYSHLVTDKDYEALHKEIVEKHHDFASIYAIVVRHIVMHNEFYDDAMRRYVNHLTAHPWKEKKEFIERQAEYLVYVEREKHPRIGSTELARYKNNVRKQLLEEDEKFDQYAKEVQETVKEEWDGIIDDRKKRLHDLLVKMKESDNSMLKA